MSGIGPWALRFLIFDKETDVLSFLTSNGVGNVVTVESGIQPTKQTWFVLPVDRKKNFYTIVQDLASERPSGLALLEHSNKVILSNKPSEWFLEIVPINLGGGYVYKIFAPVGFLPIVKVLGKEPSGPEAVIETLSNPFPAWQFSLPKN